MSSSLAGALSMATSLLTLSSKEVFARHFLVLLGMENYHFKKSSFWNVESRSFQGQNRCRSENKQKRVEGERILDMLINKMLLIVQCLKCLLSECVIF